MGFSATELHTSSNFTLRLVCFLSWGPYTPKWKEASQWKSKDSVWVMVYLWDTPVAFKSIGWKRPSSDCLGVCHSSMYLSNNLIWRFLLEYYNSSTLEWQIYRADFIHLVFPNSVKRNKVYTAHPLFQSTSTLYINYCAARFHLIKYYMVYSRPEGLFFQSPFFIYSVGL